MRVIRKVYQPRISTPGEERLEVGADHLLERDELVRRRERHPARQDLGHLDPGEALLAVRAAQHHGEREAQVGDVRERVARVDRERREDRKDVGVEVRVEVRPGRHGDELVAGAGEASALLAPARAARPASGIGGAGRPARGRLARWPRAGPPASCRRRCARRCPPPTCCLSPATRTWKNSSRLLLKMPRNLSRSSSGVRASSASCSTRRLNSSHDSSRFR